MDHKGGYITGLNPSDFVVLEDGIRQKIATFGEGNEATRTLIEGAEEGKSKSADEGAAPGPAGASGLRSAMMGANVFVLFDTSNYMYRGFVFARTPSRISCVPGRPRSHRLLFLQPRPFRASVLSPDRSQVLRGVRSTVAGDDAALYNALLLTVKDAGQISGRKVVVVFSNGPDNSSMVPPEDVAELAQSKGIPIYMISTREAKLEPVSATVFERMAAATGGEAYFAKTWRDQQKAFAAIRNDLAHLYTISYYPQPNPNHGWRAITVKIPGERGKTVRIRTRDGYRPLPTMAPSPERRRIRKRAVIVVKFRSSDFTRGCSYQTRHRSFLTMATRLQWNACPNSGIFETTPLAR